jgi:hypothetical protein
MSTDVMETAIDPIEALAGRLFSAGVDAMELCNAYLGVQLGLYQASSACTICRGRSKPWPTPGGRSRRRGRSW